MVENLQRLACGYARRSLAAGPDFFGEEHVLCSLQKFLLEKGASEDFAKGVVKNLTRADAELDCTVSQDLRAAALAPLPAVQASEDESDGEDDEDKDWVDTAFLPAAPALQDSEVNNPEAEPAAAAAAAADLPLSETELIEEAAATAQIRVPTKGFVVSKTRRGRHRKLHAVEFCRLIPGVHYREWKDLGELFPDSAEFESVCSWCMPSGGPAVADGALSGDSASSSSSSGGPPPAKKPHSEEAT